MQKVVIDTCVMISADLVHRDGSAEAREAIRTIAGSRGAYTPVFAYAVQCEMAEKAMSTGVMGAGNAFSPEQAQAWVARWQNRVTSMGGHADVVGSNVGWETWRAAHEGLRWYTGPADAAVLGAARRHGALLITCDEDFKFRVNVHTPVRAVSPTEFLAGVLQPA